MKEQPSYSLIMFFEIMVFFENVILIMGFGLHPNFWSDSLTFKVWKWNFHQLSTSKWMGKNNWLIKSWSNIYDVQPIIIKIIGQNFWPWQHNTMHSLTQQTPFFANYCLPQLWQSRCEQNHESNNWTSCHVVSGCLSSTCV